MTSIIKLISVFCLFLMGTGAGKLPSSIRPCSQSLPTDQLSDCITQQARNFQQEFVKGYSEFNLEPLDPLMLSDVTAVAGTFKIKSTNVQVKGLKKAEIREMRWDLNKNVGLSKIYGNFSLLSDYETEGRVLLVPITGSGKLTVKMYDTEMLLKFKIRKVTGEDGQLHIETYDLRVSEKFGNVKMHLSNILGGSVIGDTVNEVLNQNWRELMAEVGPTYTNAIANKVHEVINNFYANIPAEELLQP